MAVQKKPHFYHHTETQKKAQCKEAYKKRSLANSFMAHEPFSS